MLWLAQAAVGVIGNIAGKHRIAYNPSLHRGRVNLEFASSPEILNVIFFTQALFPTKNFYPQTCIIFDKTFLTKQRK